MCQQLKAFLNIQLANINTKAIQGNILCIITKTSNLITPIFTNSTRSTCCIVGVIGFLLSLLALKPVQKKLFSVVCALFPINELTAAHGIISEYLRRSSEVYEEAHIISANGEILRLLIITFHLQTATGFIGIRYVEESQRRKNELIAT